MTPIEKEHRFGLLMGAGLEFMRVCLLCDVCVCMTHMST